MNNKKTIIASIIGVALLVLTVVGATFAYFTTVTSNDEGVTNVTGKTDAIGSVALTNPTSNLHITLNALDMAQDNLNTYWATNDSTLNYDETETQREIAVATLTGGEATTHYECTTTIHVNVSGTMVEGLQTGDAYIQFGGLLTDKVDLKNVSSTGYPITFYLNGADTTSDKVSVSLAIENRNANQNSIAGKELSVTFSNEDFECNVVEKPTIFAIYSETDNSFRVYNNLDTVNVGDTYNNLAVTAKYILSDNMGYDDAMFLPWYGYTRKIEKVVVENRIKPTSMSSLFSELINCSDIDVRKIDTTNVTNMAYVFAFVGVNVSDVRILGLSDWNTSNVTWMHGMFNIAGYGSSNNNIFIGDISNWDTSKVTNMSAMFWGAHFGGDISDLSNWNVSNVTDMDRMFADSIVGNSNSNIGNISNWDTSKVTNMQGMFSGAHFGTEFTLNLSGWDVSSITTIGVFDPQPGYKDFNLNTTPTDAIIPPNFNATS